MRDIAKLSALALVAVALSASPAAAGSGPTVDVAPDDPTPHRRSDSTDPFRDRGVPEYRTRPLEQQLGHDLDRLPSRVLSGPERTIPERRLRRDLEVSEQRLRTFKTIDPDAPSIPTLERRLDRLQRPTRLGQ